MADRSVINRPRQSRVAPPFSTPSPTRGMNTVQNPAAMEPGYAISLQNAICMPDGVALRTGTRKWATGLGTAVTTLIPYTSGSTAPNKLFAVAGTNMYDVTTGGAVGAPVLTGLNATAPYWQFASQTFTAGGTNYIIAVNGTDTPRLYNGSTWSTCTQVASPSGPGQFKTGTPLIEDIVDVTLHQQRLWFVVKNTTKGYYLDIAAVGGELKPFDFGPFFANGGALHKLASWTVDAGGSSGSQALLAAISNQGDIAIYQGDDPTQASTFKLIATYKVAPPVGRRCTAKRAGDVLVMSQQGMFALSTLLQSARVDTSQTVTYNIAPTISDIAATLATLPGFEIQNYAEQDLVILNIPQINQTNNFQFVLNTITGGWSQFTGWPARCWAQFNSTAFFGAAGDVMIAFIGYKDNANIDGSAGSTIIATGLTAFSELPDIGLTGVRKHVKQLQPILTTGDSAPVLRIGVNVDYDFVPIVGSSTINPITGAVWDSALWDNPGSTWVGSLATNKQWVTPRSWPGVAVAIALSLSASAETKWVSTTWMVEPGDIYG